MSRSDLSLDGVHWVPRSREAHVETPRVGTARDEYDLAVIGGGYTGLSVAFNAARHGLSVLVLEAGSIGCGASGRNGGFVVPHFAGPLSVDDVGAFVGAARKQRFADVVAEGPGYVFDLIRRYQIDCDAEQNGWVQPAHSHAALEKVRRVYEAWRAHGHDVEWLDGEGVRERTGSPSYLGGWYGASGGTVNPYALTLGLARVARSHGVDIREHAPLIAVRDDGPAKVLETPDAQVRARQLVIATNGYTPAVPGLAAQPRRSVIPIRMFFFFTRPLTGDELAVTLPHRIPLTDIRKSGGFVRLDSENRVIAGGLVFGHGDNRGYGRRHASLRLGQIFPHLRGISFDSYWEGNCALANESIPEIQRLEDNVYSLMGYMTRGVAMSQTLGRDLGEFLAGMKDEAELPLPVTPPRPIPLQPLKALAARYAFPVFKAQDALGLS